MPFLALFTNLAFYHFSLLAFLLGAQIYQSFFANITAQQALTRSQFSILQAAIWPMYFKTQMIVSMLLALTHPRGGAAALFRGSAPVQSLFDKEVRWTVLLPLGLMFVSSASNAFFLVPKTTSIMRKLHVETAREEKARGSTGSQSQDDKTNSESVHDRKDVQKEGEKSPKVKALTNKFLAFHAASYMCAMATLATTVIYYALCIQERCL